MSQGAVVAIHVAEKHGQPTRPIDRTQAVVGVGLSEDRYTKGTATLIEEEAVEAAKRDYKIELEASETRRNIVTRGVALNHLVGKTFRVGEATFFGRELCEPCGHLEKLTRPGVRESLVHRGGLRADIVADGVVKIGDSLNLAEPQP